MQLRYLFTALASAVLAAMLWGSATAQSPGEPDAIVVDNHGTLVTFAGGTAKSTGLLRVRIDGPDGVNVFEAASKTGLVDWNVEVDLPDGTYRYDVWFVPASAKSDSARLSPRESALKASEPSSEQARPLFRSGRFTIQDGIIESHDDSSALESWELTSARTRPSALEQLAGSFLELVVPAAKAGVTHGTDDVTIDGTLPAIFFDDTDKSGSPNLQILGDESGYWFATPLLTPFFIDIDAPGGALNIEASGDIGMGTTTPDTSIEINDTFPNISLIDTDEGTGQDYEILNNGGNFYISDRTNGGAPFGIHPDASPGNSSFLLWLSNGGVAIGGHVTPTEPLHVRRTDGTAQVLVEDTNEGNITMFRLSNNGHPRFRFQNTSGSETKNWEFRTAGDGANEQFQINRITASEGSLRPMRLLKSGDVFFEGDVTANGVLLTSSRESKTDFSQVDEHSVLEKVAALDVSQWRYKREPDTERHIGPMAEDFQAVFGLGDGEHISAGDANGILFAATKALKRQNEFLQADNKQLRERLEDIEQRLDRMTE